MNLVFYIYSLLTFCVILVIEKVTYKLVNLVFKSHLKEIEQKELEIAQYQELMILALASKDKEAYKGLNQMADELYWKIFFRKLIIFSTSFFLLLSPYVFLSLYFFKSKIENVVSLIFVIAISYFMCKAIFNYIIQVLHARKEYLKNKK